MDNPTTPLPEPSPPPVTPSPRPPSPGATPWLLWLLWLTVGVSIGTVASGYYADQALKQAKTLGETVEQTRFHLVARLRESKDAHTQLQADHQALTADRDNLFAQAKRSLQENERFAGEREALEETLRQTAAERREFHDNWQALQQQYQEVQALYGQLVSERDSLQEQVAQSKTRTQEQRLKEALAKEQRASQEAAKALTHTKAKLKETAANAAKAQTKLEQVQGRFDELQEQHTRTLSQNMTLKRHAKRVPGDVTRLARQHEKLVKETAEMHYNLGVLFAKNRQYPQAVAEFHKVVELRPDDGDAHYNLGLIYAEHLPDRGRALENFRRYLQMNPKAEDASWVKQYIASWQAWEGKERLE